MAIENLKYLTVHKANSNIELNKNKNYVCKSN